MKKSFLIIMMIISLLLIPFTSYAEIAIDSKAIALNKLTILQGDGINFNLEGQLKRSEAITFIVRIMGKEAFIKANIAKYSNSSFTDVKSSDWFAAYVGWCQENKILNGFPDGGFHPNDSISEKAFLKLVLGALGYLDEQDFVWDTIYESSFNLGLVKDTKYKTQVEDNNKYLRSEVVSVLYGALTNNLKGMKKTIIEALIEANIVNRAIAVELGFAKEIIAAKIDSVTVANEVTLNVKLSKAVKPLKDQDVVIYETANKANLLKSSVTSQVYGNLLINTATQIPEKGYTIEITSIGDDAELPTVTASTFTGHKIAEVKSDYFKISKVVPVSKNVINVYFTQPITADFARPIYYDIYKNDALYVKGSINNMTVKILSEQNNVISLYLKDLTIVDDVAYSIKINGDIISAYDVQLNNGLGDSAAFTSNIKENSALKVDRTTAVDSKTIRVDFNKEVNLATAKQITNYQISSLTGAAVVITGATVPADGKGRTVLLTISGIFDRTINYTMVVNNVADLFDLATTTDANYAFSGKPTNTEVKDLKVLLVNAIDKNTLQLYLEKQIDPTAGLNTSFYMVTGVTDPAFVAFPIKAYVDPADSKLVKLTFPVGKEMINTSSYKIKIVKQMPDEQGNLSSADAISPNFTGSSEVYVKPLVLEAIIIGKDTVKVKLSKELLLSGSNLASSNYTLELKEGKNTTINKSASSVIAYDATTLIIHFDDLDFTKGYTFKFNTLTDYSGLNIRGSADGSTSILLKNGDTP